VKKKPSKLRVRLVWDVFAHFPCNSCGVRVGVRRTREGTTEFMDRFARRNRVEVTSRVRIESRIS
jgi:hypothetical protein